jgi:methylated-DNA-[protein]-cysteine S-methyltransferase
MIYTIIDSVIGDLLVTGDGTTVTGLYTAGHVRRPEPTGDFEPEAFSQARSELAEYFAGERTEFEVPIAADGTAFQQRVWAALRTVPYGSRATYREIADQIGAPRAIRAVGAANGRNPISIIVPCHRVIGSDGSLTGYAGGLAAKEWLLKLEASAS